LESLGQSAEEAFQCQGLSFIQFKMS